MSYKIRYNRTTNHIEGLEVRTEGTQLNYSKTACSALTRNGHKMAQSTEFATIEEALKAAKSRGGRQICKSCQEAAEAQI